MSFSPPAERPFAYDRKTIALHWVTATLVVLLWLIAQIIDDFPNGPLRVDARSVHIALGVTLAVVLVLRLSWRNRGQGALSPDRSGLMDRLATLGHILLYALLVLTVLAGMANAWARGDNIFNLFAIPAFDPSNRPLRQTIGTVHGWLANTLLIVAIGHALLALFHQYVLRDGVLWRMAPLKWLAARPD